MEDAAAKVEDNNRKGRHGRAARKRRRKLRSIQEAEEALRTGQPIVKVYEVLPTDRGQVWPAVYERRTFHKWTAADEMTIVGQLGYLPGNVINIATRAREVSALEQQGEKEEPVVVQLYPIVVREECKTGKGRKRKRKCLDDDKEAGTTEETLIEPFPTMYWLTHPTLRILVSKLELQSLGSTLEKRLATETGALDRMKLAHEAYGRERCRLLTKADNELVNNRGWGSAFDESRGVAGIRNHAAVKCLHAHAAHYLSGGPGSSDNIVGQWVMQRVEAIIKDNNEKST